MRTCLTIQMFMHLMTLLHAGVALHNVGVPYWLFATVVVILTASVHFGLGVVPYYIYKVWVCVGCCDVCMSLVRDDLCTYFCVLCQILCFHQKMRYRRAAGAITYL